MFDSGY